MRRRLVGVAALLVLLTLPARGQQGFGQRQTGQTRRRSRGGGSGRGGSSEGGMTPMNALPCPRGFIAQTDPGPHLQTAAQTTAKGGTRRGAAQKSGQTLGGGKVLARRCVPVKPAKSAAASVAKTAP
jgi:hypothetical protein